MRPLILLDVDGVLNRSARSARELYLAYREGWVDHEGYVDGARYRLFLNPAHGPLLLALAEETGAELAWGTTWNEHANTFIGPVLGLPLLPVAPAERGHKVDGVLPWTAGRPFVWFDDEDSVAMACARQAGTQPHLVVRADEFTGLTAEHTDTARTWLNRLCTRGGHDA